MIRAVIAVVVACASIAACSSDDLSVGRFDPKGPVCIAGVCHVDQACSLVVSDCSSVPGQSEIGPCVHRPTGCSDMSEPVCGCDGVTYVNPCYAAGAGQGIAATGACTTM